MEARRKFPTEWTTHLEDDDYVVPQGESYTHFMMRTTAALREIGKRHEGKTVIVVSHGGVIDCARSFLVPQTDVGSSIPDGRCGNASLNTFEVLPEGRWRIVRWNDVSHLAALHKEVLLSDDVVSHEHHQHHAAQGEEEAVAPPTSSSES